MREILEGCGEVVTVVVGEPDYRSKADRSLEKQCCEWANNDQRFIKHARIVSKVRLERQIHSILLQPKLFCAANLLVQSCIEKLAI